MKNTNYDRLFFSKTREFLDIYLEKQCSRSPHTVKSYRDALTIFRRYVLDQKLSIRDFTFGDCTRDFMLGFLEYLQKEGYENASCNHRLAAIKSYLWYVADGNITHQQTALAVSHVPFLRDPEKVKELLSEECLKAILSAPGDNRIGIRDTTIMVVLYDSAIRLSELLELKVCDVSLKKTVSYLRIHGKGDRERIVPISENTVGHLRRYIDQYHEKSTQNTKHLFYTVIHGRSNVMSSGNIERIIKKYAEKIRPEHSDLPQKVHPHMFRRTRATNLYQSDVELELVSRILGHASTQTTRIYAKPSLEMIKAAMDKSYGYADVEEPLWPDSEDELAKFFGLR
ncbi:MAG: tyrosine-type recombinase/integrase [Longicatena sp.]